MYKNSHILGTSIASDNSGPFLFSFVLRKRASTIGTRIPIPRRALSRQSGDSLRVPDREVPTSKSIFIDNTSESVASSANE